MGSSKKHKEKDRSERKKKRKHRSRSRSRSRDRGSRRRERRERDEREEKRPRRDRDASEDGEVKDAPTAHIKHEPGNEIAPPSGSADLSLSVSDSNKLRAKLGLKPLEGSGGKDGKDSTQEDVHKPAVNIREVKKTEELRQKMAAMREKRLINKKLGKVKKLGDSDEEDDSALAWVMKSRKVQVEKDKAEKTARLLEEMDKEFGIGNLVEEEFKPKKKEYSAKDLRGLNVEHAQESFKEGRTVILTLQDRSVLDEETDTLVNVNIQDDERAAENVDNKKKKPDYKPYDDGDVDAFGSLKPKEILDKYDEEIDGKKKEVFQIGAGGKYNTEQDRRLEQLKAEFKKRGETLELPAPVLAGEFYNEAEMASFNKVKKKVRKIRKKPKVTADSLVPLEDSGEHLGSRSRRVRPIDHDLPRSMIDKSGPIPGLDMADSMDIDMDNPLDESEIVGPDEDLTGVAVEEDRAAMELELSLNKARKVKSNLRLRPSEAMADSITQDAPPCDDDDDEEADFTQASIGLPAADNSAINIRLNSMEEFCRTLGEIPTYGMAGNRVEEEDEIMDFENELVERRQQQETEDDTGWHHVEIDTAPVEIKDEEKNVLDDEPVVNAGLSAALQLAEKKGYLDTEVKKGASMSKHKDLMEAKNYSIEDKRLDDMDDKYSRKRDRFSGGGGGPVLDFKEKDAYKPNVKLEYVDDNGRLMTQKEAFRFLSHRFHGKGSGKKKTEKRQKKVEEELLMKTMSSTDTPLNTVSLLQEKQRAEKSPYVVLSGSSKGLTASSLSK